MPAYNFKAQFAELVERGEKRQTIRASRRNAMPGDRAFLYTGMRTKACRLLRVAPLTRVTAVEIGRNGCGEPYVLLLDPKGHVCLTHSDLERFACADGFASTADFMAFFEGAGLPFKGYLFEWGI